MTKNKKVTSTVGKNVEHLDLSLTVGRSAKWYNPMEKLTKILAELNVNLPYNAAILILGLYPRKMITHL